MERRGSTIIMTETAFMTTEAWEEMTCRAINKYIAANPQWFMLRSSMVHWGSSARFQQCREFDTNPSLERGR
jgi:hypothetical protein